MSGFNPQAVKKLTSDEEKAFENYEILKKSQRTLQTQLEGFQSYLSIRGVESGDAVNSTKPYPQ